MEANFTLITMQQQLAFLGWVLEKCLKILCKFDEPLFLQIVEVLLGEEFLQDEHRYQANVGIDSMVMVWGLELGKKDEVSWVMYKLFHEEWLYGMEFLLAKAHDGVGFLVEKDVMNLE